MCEFRGYCLLLLVRRLGIFIENYRTCNFLVKVLYSTEADVLLYTIFGHGACFEMQLFDGGLTVCLTYSSFEGSWCT